MVALVVVGIVALGQAGGGAALAGARTALVAGCWLQLRTRASRGGPEQQVWRWFGGAAAVLGAGSGVDTLLRTGIDAGVVTPAAAGGAFSVATLLACPLIYRGLIVWNRVQTRTSDPGDWLNGLSATSALAAIGNLLVTVPGLQQRTADVHQLQLVLFQLAALVVVVGTTLTVATMSALLRDVRPWLITAAVLVVLALEASTAWRVGTDSHSVSAWWSSLAWTLLVVSLVVSSRLPVHSSRPQPATTQSLTIGAFVVLFASVAILIVATRLRPEHTTWSVLWAALAVLGVSTRVVHLIRDLASLAARKQEALTDELTGLANRRALSQALRAVSQGPGPVALLVLDLDRFKEVNDRFGHPAGDRLLQHLATRLSAVVPADALLARLGGDEFALLLPGADARRGVETAWVLRQAAGSGSAHPVLVSIGVAVSGDHLADDQDDDRGDDQADGSELFRQADAAMYLAKSSGQGVATYDESIDHRARGRAALAEDLQLVWSGDSPAAAAVFEVHYQPQVSLRSGQVTGVEALVRWRHPEHGLLAPAAFLDIVEERGLMSRLTWHVLTTAARDAATWHRAEFGHLRLSVNLSTSCLVDPDLLPRLELLVAAGLAPHLLVLEVTETTLMSDPGAALAACHALRAAGFGLSIDDYGTGHSSLSYLSDLPASELKVDRSFTARVLTDERVRAIIAGTVELGHQLGLRVVAEGAEDEATLVALAVLGADEVQGYVHARPRPAAALTAWLRARRDAPLATASLQR